MDIMQEENVMKLTAVDPIRFQERRHAISDDIEDSSVAFRILNRHHRVRLSPAEIDYNSLPGKTNLFAIANRRGRFITAIQQQDGFYLVCSPLNELRNSMESNESSSSPFVSFQPRICIKLAGTPCNIRVAFNEERLLVGMLDGSVIVYDLQVLDQSPSKPLSIIPAKSSHPIKTILPNTGDTPELVAILHSPSNEQESYQVEIFDVNSCKPLVSWCKGDDHSFAPVSISWSPKGKQIAIGLQSGGFLLYNPHDPSVPKNYMPRSPSIAEETSSLLSLTWVATNTFYLVYSSPESCLPSFDRSTTSSVTKMHVVLVYDPKAHTATDIEISDPTPPFGAPFPPGPLCCTIKDWSPMKFFLVCGDGSSTDIGVIGSTSNENWSRFTFEETSTPSLPLGEGGEDMALLGLDIDFTSDKPVRASEQPDDDTPDLPPSPILYAYMSDGSVVGWHILFLNGTPCPGMVQYAQGDNKPTAAVTIEPESQSPRLTTSPADVPAPSLFAPPKGFGALEGQKSSFLNAPTSATSQPTPMNSSSSGFGKSSAPTFGVTGWGFGSQPSASSSGSVNTIGSAGGFAAFAQSKPSSFGALSGTPKTSVFDQPSESSGQTTPTFGAATSTPVFASALSGGGFSSPTASSKPSLFSAQTTNISSKFTGFGSFGAKVTDSATTDSASNKPSGALNSSSTPKALDTWSALGGSLNDTAGSPPGSPTMGESPTASPVLENVDLPKPPSSYIKPASGLGAFSGTIVDSKPISSFIKPGFGAFGVTPSDSTSFLSSNKPSFKSESSTGIAEVPSATESQVKGSTTFPNKHTQPVFGVSGFGTKPAAPTFGVSGFAEASGIAVKSEPSKSLSGGFSAFAGGGFSSFAKSAQPSSFDSLLRQSDVKTTSDTTTTTTTSATENNLVPERTVSTKASPAIPQVVEEKQDEKKDEKKPPFAVAEKSKDSPFGLAAPETAKLTATQDSDKEAQKLTTEESLPKTVLQDPGLAKTDKLNTAPARIESLSSTATGVVQKVPEAPPAIIAAKAPSWLSSATGSSSVGTIPQPSHVPGSGIGLGRPSSRPARSSPLANTPMTLANEESASAPPSQGTSTPKVPVPPSLTSPHLSSFPWKSEISNVPPKMNEFNKQSFFSATSPAPHVTTPGLFSAAPKFNADMVKPNESQDNDTHPLQIEFFRAYEEFCGELINLGKRLDGLKVLFPAIQTPRGLEILVKNNNDFVPGKYSFGDLDPFKSLIAKLHEKVRLLLEEGKVDKLLLAELQNLALISETKREELSRWVKAKDDPDFAKILKSRSLGPEHTENQLRLRKLLQITSTRLQQCEDIMQALQKKLNQEKTGKAVFQAPTLDTIDRTCRNIKMALEERTEIVDKLSERVKTISSLARPSLAADLSTSSSPPAPMPSVNIAVAALNSERSCLILKNALSNARQRPLFTEKVTRTLPSAKSPHSETNPIFSRNMIPTPDMNALAGSSSSLLSHDSTDRRRQSRKHTSIAVPLKPGTEKEVKAPAGSFDWGPLPTLSNPPPKKLPFEFKASTKESA